MAPADGAAGQRQAGHARVIGEAGGEGVGEERMAFDVELPREARRLYIERHRQADTPSEAPAAPTAAGARGVPDSELSSLSTGGPLHIRLDTQSGSYRHHRQPHSFTHAAQPAAVILHTSTSSKAIAITPYKAKCGRLRCDQGRVDVALASRWVCRFCRGRRRRSRLPSPANDADRKQEAHTLKR